MDTKNWKRFRIGDLFIISRGKTLPLDLKTSYKGNIPCINGTSNNNGILCFLSDEIENEGFVKQIIPYLSLCRVGTSGLTFVQTQPYYIADNAFSLYLKQQQSVYVYTFLSTILNRECYKYSYGRTISSSTYINTNIKLPSDKNGNPDWQWTEDYVKNSLVPKLPDKSKSVWKKNFDTKPLLDNKLPLNTKEWKWFRYIDIFEIKKGKRLTKADMIVGKIPYIGAIDSNNGVSSYISNNEQLHSANTITVSYNGSIAEAYYQAKEFWATDDVNVLYPKFLMNAYSALFLTTIINKEKYRFNYGRKWDKELMESSKIKLPINEQGNPDWQWMEDYIKGLPYSGCL